MIDPIFFACLLFILIAIGSRKVCSEFLHLFLAEDLIPSVLEGDDDEMIDLIPLSIEECLDKIEKGEICDAKTAGGILIYERMMKK